MKELASTEGHGTSKVILLYILFTAVECGELTTNFGYMIGALVGQYLSELTLRDFISKEQRRMHQSGKASKSEDRKKARIDMLWTAILALVDEFPSVKEMDPIEVAKLALKRILKNRNEEKKKLWTQGQGKLADYLSEISSSSATKDEYVRIFHGATNKLHHKTETTQVVSQLLRQTSGSDRNKASLNKISENPNGQTL